MDVIKEIMEADPMLLERILQATRKRFAELYPDWDYNLFCVPKVKDRNTLIDSTIAVMESMKDKG